MKVWIIYKDNATSLKLDAYGIHRFLEVAAEDGVDVQVLRPDQFELVVTREDKRSILVESKATDLPDAVLPRMGAGTTYFALAVIRHLERFGVYSLNDSRAIETVRDKLLTQQILAQNNLPVPRTMLAKFPVDVEVVREQIGFPVVVKTITGSQGSGVFLAETKSALRDLMLLIEQTNSKANIILQEFIAPSRGWDLRVLTLGGRVLACMKRMAREDDFKANYSMGGAVEPFEVTPEIEWLATQTSQLLNLDMAGVDLLWTGERFVVCEANSSPGFQGLEACCNVNVAREVYHFLRIRLGLSANDPAKNDTVG